jgi:hypothetical protein
LGWGYKLTKSYVSLLGCEKKEREYKNFRMALFSIVLVLGIAGAASTVTLTDETLFTATGMTQAEEVIGDRVISHRFLRAS